MSLESGFRLGLFFIGVVLLSSLLVYGTYSSMFKVPSLPSGEINGLDLVIYMLNTLFTIIANIFYLLFQGITLTWIPYPYNIIIGLPFWALTIIIAINLISGFIEKLKGWI